MPKQRIVTTPSDGTYVSISATIPCHFLRVYLDSDRNSIGLDYKLSFDSFTQVFVTDPTSGDIIELLGPGRHGFLGIPAAFSASGQAATVMIKIKTTDNSAKDLVVYESENSL